MTTSEFIGIAGLGLTLVTSLATLWTILELRRQRQNTYMPDVFIVDSYVEYFGYDRNEKYSDFNFLRLINSERSWKYTSTGIEKSSSLHIPISNIGFGTAKYVYCEWFFSLQKIYQLLFSSNKSSEFNIDYEKQENDQFAETIRIETSDKNHYNNLSYDLGFRSDLLNFVPPLTTIKTIFEITVPRAYIQCMCYYLAFKYDMFTSNGKDFIHDNLEEFPPIHMAVKYTDVGNNDHAKKFLVKITVSGMSSLKFSKPIFGTHNLGTFHIATREIN